jgi:hypothetical protein
LQKHRKRFQSFEIVARQLVAEFVEQEVGDAVEHMTVVFGQLV